MPYGTVTIFLLCRLWSSTRVLTVGFLVRHSTSDFPAHYNYHSTGKTGQFDAAVPKTQ